MPHDVFVSYSSDDKPTADAVCATLENKGIRCWIAPRDILPGVDWGGAIVDAINASRVMVLVYSAKANDSPQIKREVERAVHRGLSVIPFRIEDVPMSTTLEYFMSMPHWLDALTPPLQDHLDRLADTTRLILERAGVVLATPPGGQTTDPAAAARPLTTSRDIAQGIGRWVTGGTESPTLAEVFVPRSDRVATTMLIGASVIAISVLAQVRIGPIWVQPLAVLLTGAILGSRGGGLAATIYIALAILGLPVFGPGISAWTSVDFHAPLCPVWPWISGGADRGSFRRRLAERAALVGPPSRERCAPGARRHRAHVCAWVIVWLEVAALLMRETRGPRVCLPSIPMLVITVAVVAFGLPRAWAAVAAMQRAASESRSGVVPTQSTPTETTHTNSSQ